MTEIKILEIIVCVMLVANVVGFGVLYGKVNFFMSVYEMWFDHWIRERKE